MFKKIFILLSNLKFNKKKKLVRRNNLNENIFENYIITHHYPHH
jgi:hypothetical protein